MWDCVRTVGIGRDGVGRAATLMIGNSSDTVKNRQSHRKHAGQHEISVFEDKP